MVVGGEHKGNLPRERENMTNSLLVFWLILDPITFGLGSIGAYILFQQFVEHERFPKGHEWFVVLREHWFAVVALTIAIGYFLFRLFSVVGGNG